MLKISSSISKIKFSKSLLSGIPLHEIIGFLIFPLLDNIKVISKYPFIDKFFLSLIDFGTATTFDIVKNGTYEGGVISPGINLSILNLNKSTALLPVLNLKKIQKSYGKNTQEALNAGFLWGYEGLINNIIKRISSKSNLKFKIILTGGYAKLFKRYIKSKTIVDQNITIKGIAGIFKKMI